jgi:hypothetical protein
MQKAQLLEVKEKGGTSMLTKVRCSSAVAVSAAIESN